MDSSYSPNSPNSFNSPNSPNTVSIVLALIPLSIIASAVFLYSSYKYLLIIRLMRVLAKRNNSPNVSYYMRNIGTLVIFVAFCIFIGLGLIYGLIIKYNIIQIYSAMVFVILSNIIGSLCLNILITKIMEDKTGVFKKIANSNSFIARILWG